VSHFDQIMTKVSNKEILIQACKLQGEVLQVKESWMIRGYQGQCVHGDIVAVLEGNYDLGFNKSGDVYAGVADFSFGTCGQQESKGLEALWQRIIQTYSRLEVEGQASSQRGLSGANITVSVH
jgi:Protein of unknown function (DUF1257)